MNRTETLTERTEGISTSEKALVYGFLLVVLIIASLFVAKPAHAETTFTVNRTGDASDRNINNSVCDTSTQTGNQCTLRAAIEEANDTPGADEIRFNINSTSSVKTIKPASPLPTITDPVTIDGYSQPGASENTLDVGNNAVLKVQLSGANAGVGTSGLTLEASDSTIRGLAINRFDAAGIVIFGFAAINNRIEGNFVGTNAAGTAGSGNSDGIQLLFTRDNTVGGTANEARNIISGNESDGISGGGNGIVIRSGNDNEILNNYVGTDKNGTSDLGNSGVGVGILAGDDNIIGGTTSGAGNVISGNADDGIHISGESAPGNNIAGNFIGTDATGTADLGNSGDGVSISQADNTVGGNVSGAGNRIAFNDGNGVLVPGGATGIRVLSNSIFSNGGLGIDLGSDGVTANDTKDLDTGANNLQNFPKITSAVRNNSTGLTTISGTLNSSPFKEYTIQCFVADNDPSGHGEGQILAGEDTTVTTDANGAGSFSCSESNTPQAGQTVTATATNTDTGDTSEFAAIVKPLLIV